MFLPPASNHTLIAKVSSSSNFTFNIEGIEKPIFSFLGLRQFLVIEAALKMMNINAFYFMLKALFLRYLNFCPDFLVL